ncbi:cytochrome P450 [Irpex lacteus]|nr:cytochrome P450 [Irpex lacteus]
MTTTIPVPPYIPVLTHAVQIDTENPDKTFNSWMATYGEIFEIHIFRTSMILVSSAALCAELSNDQRFTKSIDGDLTEIRALVSDGLFTARKEEPNWGIARTSPFNPQFQNNGGEEHVLRYVDIASQLVLKWERISAQPHRRLHLSDAGHDRYLLYVIPVQLFYRDDNHPFVQAMYDFLTECGRRMMQPAVADYIFLARYRKWQEDIKYMTDLAQTIVDKRRRHPIDKEDLLNVMLKMWILKPAKHLITFLIAGHETTSGLLSFCVYYLIKHPNVMRKAQTEVDDVLGDQQLQPEDLSKFPYLTAIIRETLRVSTTITGRQVYANEDTTIGNGKYFIKKGQQVVILFNGVHKDKAVWGEDAEEFKPERMLDGKFEALPVGAWQPFGFGARVWPAVCDARSNHGVGNDHPKFNFELADPDYELEVVQTLTVKPRTSSSMPSLAKMFSRLHSVDGFAVLVLSEMHHTYLSGFQSVDLND